MGVKKLPTVKSLQVEFAELLSTKRPPMPISKRFVTRCVSCLSIRQTMRSCETLRNARIAKNKSVAVNNGHALIALAHEMWQCAAADKICVKGVRGCFPDKVFGGFRAQRKSSENALRTLDAQLAVISQILCKRRFWCKIEQNIFKAGAAQAAAALSTK